MLALPHLTRFVSYYGQYEKEPIKKTKQDRLIEHFVTGAAVRCDAGLVGMNPKIAMYYFHRLREIITYHRKNEADTIFSGEI